MAEAAAGVRWFESVGEPCALKTDLVADGGGLSTSSMLRTAGSGGLSTSSMLLTTAGRGGLFFPAAWDDPALGGGEESCPISSMLRIGDRGEV